MIKYYKVHNFKSLKDIDLTLRPLNAFMGMNGMGKSSVIQSLLVLRQTVVDLPQQILNETGIKTEALLNLNNGLVRLGPPNELLCQNGDDDVISARIKFSDDNQISADFEITQEAIPGFAPKGNIEISSPLSKEALFNGNFRYLSAEHLGPQRLYSTSGWNINGINSLGNEGEFAVPFLSVYGEKIIVPDAMHEPSAKTHSLMDETSAWMREISSDIRMSATYNPSEQNAKLNISFDGKDFVTENISPVNVGFGIPYVLPVIVALLSSKKEDLIIIENPESHLHPKGQTKIAELICRAVSNGAQVICETHSDHVINSFRVSVKNQIINKDDIGIKFFERDEDLDSNIIPIDVDSNGNLSDYPIGLLDEWGNLMAELI